MDPYVSNDIPITLRLSSTRHMNELITYSEISQTIPVSEIWITLQLKVESSDASIFAITHDFTLKLTPDCTKDGVDIQS